MCREKDGMATARDRSLAVLLVEDDPEVGVVFNSALEQHGIINTLVSSGEEALHELDMEKYDAVVSDIRLEGMSGVDLLRRVRELDEDFPVILLTAYDSIESAVEAVRLGAQDYILKPLDTIEDLSIPLRKAVEAHRNLLRNRRLERELKKSSERYQGIIEDTPLLMCRYLPDGALTFVNRAFCERYSIDADSVRETNFFHLISPEHKRHIENGHPRLTPAAPVTNYECEQGHLGNRQRWQRWIDRAIFDRDGSLLEYQCVGEDVTERHLAEDELRSSRDQLRQLAARLLDVREEERTRISREIHDELGHSLTVLKMDLARIGRNMPDSETAPAPLAPTRDAILKMCKSVDETIETVRRIATELRPGLLDNLGICAAIDWMAQNLQERSDLRFVLQIPGSEPPIDDAIATGLFRIFEETITNVVRHANASIVRVTILFSKNSLTLEICNDGKAITNEEVMSPWSIGILGMKERARQMNAELTITGQDDAGTTVRVVVPIGSSERTDGAYGGK